MAGTPPNTFAIQTNKYTSKQTNKQTSKQTNKFKQIYMQAGTQAGIHAVRPADGDTDLPADRQKETNREPSVFL